ncbi:unnamed protein product [Urochloa decumbens]|uniref:F-box domain-containing protein n=1 Tax=Urochloa decumbens TaxID=240449 RepID=A0ABC9FSJ9_9POAL
MDMDAIPIELLELILLFIVSPVFLLRAALACKQWRRIIADADFLRRFRCLHRPPVAGHYYDTKRFSPSSPSVVDGRYFSLDFLRGDDFNHGFWRLKDSRGSFLLLDFCDYNEGFQYMVICEPVTKRFLKIPPSTALARYRYCNNSAFLLDGDNVQSGGNSFSISRFKVLCLLHCYNRIRAGVFTWGESWQETSIESNSMELIGLAMGSMYWYAGDRKVVTLDQSSNEFSSFLLPDIEDWDCHIKNHRLAITAGRDGRACIVVGVTGGDMKVFSRLPVPGGNCEWVLKKRMALFMAIRSLQWHEPWYFNPQPISNHRTGAVLIVATTVSLLPQQRTPLMIRLDIETMAVERMPDPNLGTAYPCELAWPPVFRACTDHCG